MKLGSMQKTIDSQHDTICNLNRNINKLNVEVSKRNAIIEDLRKRLAKYETPDKNSNNSSTPPSKEKIQDEVVRRTKTLRKTSGRKPGGQAGHKGCTLLKTDSPDSVENIIPNYCNECGNSLEDSELVMDYVTQVISLPEMEAYSKRNQTLCCYL